MAKRKPSVYNHLLKETTKVNNRRPKDERIPIKERRRIVREVLLPKYEDTPIYKIRVGPVKELVQKEFKKLPAEGWDVRIITGVDVGTFANIEYFDLDKKINDDIPYPVYVKVTAREYGETDIFKRSNYDYIESGVKDIVDAIREEASSESGTTFLFTGYAGVRPNRPDNGNPNNYYLDLILDQQYGEPDIEVPEYKPLKKGSGYKKKLEAEKKKLKDFKAIKRRLLKNRVKEGKKPLSRQQQAVEDAKKKLEEKLLKKSAKEVDKAKKSAQKEAAKATAESQRLKKEVEKLRRQLAAAKKKK